MNRYQIGNFSDDAYDKVLSLLVENTTLRESDQLFNELDVNTVPILKIIFNIFWKITMLVGRRLHAISHLFRSTVMRKRQ